MQRAKFRKILADYTIVGLLTATMITAGCSGSDRQNISDKQTEEKKTQEKPVVSDDVPGKTIGPADKGTKIRGKSG